jgi:hypothetical protein
MTARSGVMFSNSNAMGHFLKNILDQADRMFSMNALVHYYTAEGMFN